MAYHLDWIDGLSYDAVGFRHPIGGMVQSGIVDSSDLTVSAQSTPNMSVLVGPGSAFVVGNAVPYQGAYFFLNDAAVNVAVGAASTEPRIDIIAIQIIDPSVSSGTIGATIVDIAGTPSTAPVPPTLPSDCYALAQVAVGASVTSIAQSDITYEASLASSRLQVPYSQITGVPAVAMRLYCQGFVFSGSSAVQVNALVTGWGSGNISNSGDAITINVAGIYQVSWSCQFQVSGGTPGDGAYYGYLFVNGSQIRAASNTISQATTFPVANGSDLVNLAVGDVLELWAQQSGTGDVEVNHATGTYISAGLLIPT